MRQLCPNCSPVYFLYFPLGSNDITKINGLPSNRPSILSFETRAAMDSKGLDFDLTSKPGWQPWTIPPRKLPFVYDNLFPAKMIFDMKLVTSSLWETVHQLLGLYAVSALLLHRLKFKKIECNVTRCISLLWSRVSNVLLSSIQITFLVTCYSADSTKGEGEKEKVGTDWLKKSIQPERETKYWQSQ